MNAPVHSSLYAPDFLVARILYRDALILIIDKPAGLPVHKGTGGGENLEQYFEALRFGLPQLPALGHRLDRETSGCLILGRQRHALQTLGKLFSDNKISKTYWAIVKGTPAQPEGRIDAPLAKQSPSGKRWHMKIADDGQPATTLYKVMGTHEGYSWLEMTPLTGRTHQLRVHCASLGCPIVGDRIYGDPAPEGFTNMLHLHARSITVPLYYKKPDIAATAPAPEHMQDILKQCGATSET
jgi:tRNA pseudouridine32 synthase/23S rRNA pseudouridine746 synthase/23S rRNA pseudouridine1911/1915/1917 synthase